MIDKPLNQLNRFFEVAAERMLSGSDQLVYLHLFNIFNRAHWTETIRVTDRQLLESIKLYDSNGKPAAISVIRNAKARLKLKGLIDFKSGKGSDGTEYTLVKLYPVDTPVHTPIDTPVGAPVDTGRRSNYAHAKDVEDVKDVKTFKERKKESAGAKNFEELDCRIRHAWIQSVGENPFGGFAEDLLNLQKRYGAEKVVAAIGYCRRHLQTERVTIAQISGVLKGGNNKNGRRDEVGQSAIADRQSRIDVGTFWGTAELPPGVKSRFEGAV